MPISRKILTTVVKIVFLGLIIGSFALSTIQNTEARDISTKYTEGIVRSQLWHLGVENLQVSEIKEIEEVENKEIDMPEELERAMVIHKLKSKGMKL